MNTSSQVTSLDDEDILTYLRDHPDFLARYPALLDYLILPSGATGKLEDFQDAALKRLREQAADADAHVQSMVDTLRAQQAMQTQLYRAVNALVSATSLEQFFSCLTSDVVSIFNADVVRLGLESPTPNPFESYYPEQHYSGMVLIAKGAVAQLFEQHEQVWLVGDQTLESPELLEGLFSECSDLARSCAYMRMALPRLDRHAVLAIGTRHAQHFTDAMPTPSWQFLGHITASLLEQHLVEQVGLL